jgi:hypothetical protein
MANPSSTLFDPLLSEIPHFAAIPAMLPYVGADYASTSHGKLLLIGESFYFPDESTIHRDAERWYELSEADLNGDEVEYICCRGLLECPWGAPGHAMYREINRCLDAHELVYEDRAISHVAFANAFFRPAEVPGGSFKHCGIPLDYEKSRDITEAMIRILQPDLVIYVSKFAWDSSGQFVAQRLPEIPFRFTSHPANPFHWNRKSYEHGRSKFMELLKRHFLPSVPTGGLQPE